MQIYTMPKPTIAAICGHAIAGGTILALCCDCRYIAEGRNLMGLNEIKLGVPVPYLADCILRSLVRVHYAREIMERGDFFDPERCLYMGLVDRILPGDQVIDKAIEEVEKKGLNPPKAFSIIKQNRIEIVLDQYYKRYEEKRDTFINCWYSVNARPLLKEAIKKF
jgi:enoyl-CoA hydratase/carnithine racemase